MLAVSSQRNMGRLDEIMVLDELNGEQLMLGGRSGGAAASLDAVLRTSECRALAAVASLLKGLPHALMQAEQQRGVRGGAWMPELAVPQSLMLAVYPGET